MKKRQVAVRQLLQALLICCAVHVISHTALAKQNIEPLVRRSRRRLLPS
jgi:hypothetical protein